MGIFLFMNLFKGFFAAEANVSLSVRDTFLNSIMIPAFFVS